MANDERRRQTRFLIRECLLKCSKTSLLAFLRRPGSGPLPVSNLSLGGLEFVSPDRLNAGQSLRMRVDVPAFRQVLHLAGRVRWAQPVPDRKLHRVGVEFAELDEDTRDKLRRLKNDPLLCEIRRARRVLL